MVFTSYANLFIGLAGMLFGDIEPKHCTFLHYITFYTADKLPNFKTGLKDFMYLYFR